jgi:hypothetical protein
MGTEPVDWRRLEVSIGVSYDASSHRGVDSL